MLLAWVVQQLSNERKICGLIHGFCLSTCQSVLEHDTKTRFDPQAAHQSESAY